MVEPSITCPNCKSEVKLTESLAAPLVEAVRKQYEAALREKDSEIRKRESALRDHQAEFEKEVASFDEKVAKKVADERGRIAAEESAKAKRLAAIDLDEKGKEIGELRDILKQREEKLGEAQKAQADLIRKERELDDAKRAMELTVEQKVQASLEAVRGKARKEAEDGLNLKVAEKELQISSMQKQIDELKRKAEQGSQQLQGEVLELAIEASLRAAFPLDSIEPVPKGEFGSDVLHRVSNAAGQECGLILWETKRTKNWSDAWLAKLRENKRAANAEIALLVSHALPKEITAFGLIDGVWVTEPRCYMPVAIALRQSLIEVSAARQAVTGQQTKMEMVYQYLTGPRFRHRIEAIVEKFSDMQSDLDKERKTMTRLWAKREAQIRGVIESTAGMYGDLQGIAGQSLQEVAGLDLQLLDGPPPPPIDQTDE